MKKHITIVVHFAFIFFILLGIGLMFVNSNYGRGLSWLITKQYEDSSDFEAHFKRDISHIFDYVNYRDVFETDGKLDFSKDIVGVSEIAPNEEELIFTLDDLIRYAKTRGFTLDDNQNIVSVPVEDTNSIVNVRVNWKAYKPTEYYSGPGDMFSTMDDLSKETLSCLGDYYKVVKSMINQPSNIYFQVSYRRSLEEVRLYTNAPDKSIDDLKALGKYCYTSGSSLSLDTNLDNPPVEMTVLAESVNPYGNNDYYAIVAIDTSYSAMDSYSAEKSAFKQMRVFCFIGLICIVTGLAGCLITLYQMIVFSKEKKLIYLDRVSFEGSLFLSLAGMVLFTYLSDKTICKLFHTLFSIPYWGYIDKVVHLFIIYLICLVEGFSLLRRYHARTLWSNSMFRNVRKYVRLYFLNHSFTLRLAIYYSLFLVMNLCLWGGIFFISFQIDGPQGMVLSAILGTLLFLLDFWGFHMVFHNAWEQDRIDDAVKSISSGNTSYQIDTSLFTGKERVLAESINNIGTGLETAIQEQVKSERLKADLITNVSHDIKTPLTSIINYVDLIKREQLQNPKVLDYLNILEQKSQRLKTLTEDLVEASKASSGNLKLEIMDIDFGEMIYQTNGEFEEKFQARNLELVTSIPEKGFLIEADGRRLWRVLENLYTNAFKYAMEGSRIYVDLKESKNGSQAVFTIKNVSSNPLNISPDELTERFVRGDVARTTEGSGLGLSIAKSLTNLQKGIFNLQIDGDLFKVELIFPIKKAPEVSA
ncbi:HAMP domain-containing sensor histidine kinase [Lachnospiraceae bacterium 62-35]